MNIKMISSVAVVAVAAGLATGCSSLKGMMPKSEAVAGLEAETQSATENIGKARSCFARAYAEMADAYGMHKEAESLRGEAKRLAKNDDISYSDESKAIKESVDAKFAKAEAIEDSPEKKKHVQNALIELGKGLLAETEQIAVTAQLATDAKTIAEEASVQDKPAALDLAATAVALASEVPGDVKMATQTLAAWRAQAKTLGVEIPKDAEKADEKTDDALGN